MHDVIQSAFEINRNDLKLLYAHALVCVCVCVVCLFVFDEKNVTKLTRTRKKKCTVPVFMSVDLCNYIFM